jgi:multiple antibiotic resistance protein
VLTFAKAIPFCFGALFPFLNPLDSAVMFLALTMGFSAETRHGLALKVGVNTFLLLTIVLFTGSWVLRFFGISVPVVQIGGGSVVAYIGWTMLNRPADGTEGPPPPSEKQAPEMAFFPLTMPLTAGPGCIAVTLTVGAHEVATSSELTLLGQAGAATGIALGALTVFVCYRYADGILRVLGKSGRQVIVRLAAFINLCIGIQMVWHGIQGLQR